MTWYLNRDRRRDGQTDRQQTALA